ncbi:MAG: hypothetical protein JST75_03750 [Bacteroidetes bacterium]|nr:hypothetical protein [Bacteroidota bacterium]
MNKHLVNKWIHFWENQSIQSGQDFEDDVADEFFPDNIYEMLHRTHDFQTNRKRFIRSSLDPDFRFEIRGSNVSFWVECKHRENNRNASEINIFKSGQLERYHKYENAFLLLCTYRYDEQMLYLVPFIDIKWNNLFLSFLRPYELTLEPPVMPGLIRKYLG